MVSEVPARGTAELLVRAKDVYKAYYIMKGEEFLFQ